MKAWPSKVIIIVAAIALVLAGCGENGKRNEGSSGGDVTVSSTKVQVVTTFYPMYEFTRQVAGEHADVVALVPAGAEPHDWEPSPKDMARIKEADVFVYNGIVEGWVEQALKSAPNDKRIVVEASSGIELMEGEEHDHGHGHGEEEHSADGHDHEAHEGDGLEEDEHDHDHEAHEEDGHEEDEHDHEAHEEDGHEEDHHAEEEHVLDPHVWLSPVLAQQQVRAIQEALAQADPEHKDDYKANADAYIAKLKELDEAFKEGLKDVIRTEFVTQHMAFGYLAREYGLTQIPIAGLSPDQEPSPEKMAEIIKFAKEHQVKTIFFETLADPKIARTIADEIGAGTDVLNPIEGLTEEDKKNGLDYIGIMTQNLEALKKALNE